MNNLGVLVRKYSVPFIFIVVGLIILIVGLTNGQNNMFLLAAGMILIAGVLSALFSLGKLKPVVVMALGGVFGAIAVVLIILSITSVSTSVTYENNRDKAVEISKQNLTDIRFLQRIHKDKYGTYIDNWDDLIDFAKNGTMPYIDAQGTVPSKKINVEERDYLYGDDRAIDNKMTEEEALRLSKWKEGPRYEELFKDFVRDTNQVSILKTKFQNASYRENRKKSEIYAFAADSLPIIPFTGGREKWSLKTRDSVKVADIVGPTLRVEGKLPFAELEGTKEMIHMFFGSLSTFDLEGSWEQDK